MNKTQKNTIIAVIVVVILVVIGLAVHFLSNGQAPAPAQTTPSATSTATSTATTTPANADQQAVEDLVTNFIQQFKNVNLSDPKGTLVQEIQTNYSPYISSDILNFWESSPAQAPGRVSASTWPYGIAIKDADIASDGSYDVAGEVEVTSTVANIGISQNYQLFLKVREQSNKWVITGYQAVVPNGQ